MYMWCSLTKFQSVVSLFIFFLLSFSILFKIYLNCLFLFFAYLFLNSLPTSRFSCSCNLLVFFFPWKYLNFLLISFFFFQYDLILHSSQFLLLSKYLWYLMYNRWQFLGWTKGMGLILGPGMKAILSTKEVDKSSLLSSKLFLLASDQDQGTWYAKRHYK